MSRTGIRVAIDGPSGTGKSSVSKMVAREFGYGYLDTGAMYRALTWWCVDQQIDLADVDAVVAQANSFDLRMGTDPSNPTVAVGERSIDQEIREHALTVLIAPVATNLGVRAVMKQRQRDLMESLAAEHGGVVAEGRDITTVVAPDAEVRILMTASEEARLARRSKELSASVEATRAQIVDRDRSDATVSQFLTAADGVTTIDTSQLTFEQSVQAVLQVIGEATGRG
ncbi:(d)CMP kinase [Yimella sp. cx-51]|uniref:(d)CMP kinase n=1 Tax=Yimella sp. cx-51 TaxID=2770551 RepID=UPI00165EB1FD|nr:(d)CMP kinase [Yimella sp. cx-51]MBC9957761.1 (d)CMP kinase [Yimella sp. cx-51]QTH36896.1 (d)CMP kinase [Yimella sp. cx-51]